MVAAVGAALVRDLLVREDGAERGAPVDRHLGHVREPPFVHRLAQRVAAQPLCLQLRFQFRDRPRLLRLRIEPRVEELEKYPLRPPVVVRVRRGHAARPVVGEPEHLDLPLDVRDVALGRDARVDAVLHGVLLGRQAERVVAHRVQNVEALHALEARHDVRGRVALGMPDVQARAARVREHIQDVELRVSGVRCQGDAERRVLLPVRLPLLLDLGKGIRSHLCTSAMGKKA